jgi:hypothetical protein
MVITLEMSSLFVVDIWQPQSLVSEVSKEVIA